MIKLAVFDVDDTLTVDRSIWEQFYLEIGTWEKIGQKFWNMFKNQQINFDEFMRLDVGAFAGNHESVIFRAIEKLSFIGGITETVAGLKQKGIKTAIISGTIGQFAVHLKNRHGFDYCFANPLLTDENNILTGEIEMAVPPMQKDLVLKKLKGGLGLTAKDVLAVGDSEIDLKMFDEAGFCVCVNHAKESIKKRVDFILPDRDLRPLLNLV